VALFPEVGEIKAAGTSADDCDTHDLLRALAETFAA
jgi:hypothetical protein